MSITTRKGDGGETDLLFGRRVKKSDVGIGAVGDVDELNAALGVARVFCSSPETERVLAAIQEHLIGLMGMLSVAVGDEARYRERGYSGVGAAEIGYLDEKGEALEREGASRFHGWARPGSEGRAGSAFLDVARTVCRRAERSTIVARGEGFDGAVYLNRLSDVLWLLARDEAHERE